MTRRKPPNWRTRLIIIRSKITDDHGDPIIRFDLEFDKKPKGFSKQQGYLILDADSPYQVRSARVHRQFHHRGVGYTLYTYALKKLGELATEYNIASPKARKLWRRLMSDFEHSIEHDMLIVFNRRIRVRKRK